MKTKVFLVVYSILLQAVLSSCAIAQLSWDRAGLFPLATDPGYNASHRKWVSMMNEGEYAKVASECAVSLSKGSNDFITAKIFVACATTVNNVDDYAQLLAQMRKRADSADVLGYINLMIDYERGKQYWADSKKLRTEEATRRAFDAERNLWEKHGDLGKRCFPALAVLVWNVEASILKLREMGESYLKSNRDDRRAKLLMIRLYARGRYGFGNDRVTGKERLNQYGNTDYYVIRNEASDFEKAFQVADELLRENPNDWPVYYYKAYTYMTQWEYLPISNQERAKKVEKAKEAINKFLGGKNLPPLLVDSARRFLQKPSYWEPFQLGVR